MIKKIEKICSIVVFILGFFVIAEIAFAYYTDCLFYPIKSENSFGFIEKRTHTTIIPLNQCPTRAIAQILLPFKYAYIKLTDKKLTKKYDNSIKKYGYQNNKNIFVIKPIFVHAHDFKGESAIVSIYNNKNIEKYGTIDKKGNWIIEPKYDFLCPTGKYYIRACIDKNHCGVIDKFGNQVILMTYSTSHLECTNSSVCEKKFCTTRKTRKKQS